MQIPKSFTIHAHQINVYIKEIDLERNRYGYYDDVKEEIVIFTKIKSDNEIITLTRTQLECSFLHELVHCLQWHVKGETNEQDAQTYAGIILEYLKTSTQ